MFVQPSTMLKMYSIVEFSDGVQIIPSCWMNAEKTNSVWPSHIRNDYTLNRIIMKGDPPREGDNWDTCSIIKWFFSTDKYIRALELWTDAMDTSNVEESDGKDKGQYYIRRPLQERKRSNTRVALSSEEEDSPYERPIKKQKTGLPVPSLRKLLQQDFTNTPTGDYFEEMPSTVDVMTHAEEIQISAPPTAASAGPTRTAISPLPSPTTASPGPSSIVSLPRPLPRAKSSSSSSQFETFMRKSIAAINLRLNDMQNQLNRIERRETINPDNRNITTALINVKTEISTTHNLPINDEEGLRSLNNKLLDTAVFNNMVDVLKRTGGSNVPITTASVLQKLINDCVAATYSWCGRNKKKTFKNYKYIVKLVLASVHAACSDSGLKATDLDIVNAAGKWLAQSKKRIVRAERKSKNDQDRTAVDSAV